MVKTLQKKFIFAAMIVVTILLLTLIGAINILNYFSVTDLQKRMLETLCETDGQPERSSFGRRGSLGDRTREEQMPAEGSQPGENGTPGTSARRNDGGGQEPGEAAEGSDPQADRMGAEDTAPPSGQERPEQEGEGRLGEKEKQNSPLGLVGRKLSIDDMMSMRFFSVWFDEEGGILGTDVSRIYSVSEEEAEEIAKNLYTKLSKGEKKRGTSGSIRYILYFKDRTENPAEDSSGTGESPPRLSGSSSIVPQSVRDKASSLLVAMDCSVDFRDILAVLGISTLIAVLGWLLMLIPVYFLAKGAIAPVALSIERQKQFVTNAGHELKTPVAIIQTNTEALELFNGESKWTRNIRMQTDRLNGLMQNLLTLSKMDENALQLKMGPFPLGPLVSEVWENFAESAESKDITFVYERPSEGTDSVLANRESISQLLSILFDNAVKYTPRGGSIEVSVSREAGKIRLVQSNTVSEEENGGEDGKGNLPEDPNRLFERFYRADQDRSRKKGGFGIGLSAARAITEANKGSIRAGKSEAGISFIVLLKKE